MEVLGCYSERGDGIKNEDAVGYKNNYFWVIDGATDLYKLNLFGCEDDVAYYVNNLSDNIATIVATEADLEKVLSDAIFKTNDKLKLDIKKHKIYEMPSFAILIGKCEENTCEYIVLGDCFLQIRVKGKIIEITDKRLTKFSMMNKNGLNIIKRNGTYSKENEIDVYRQTREQMNVQDGYWIGSVDGKGIPHALKGKIEIDRESVCLAYTDGLMEAFSLFQISDINTSVFDNKRLMGIVKQLRLCQTADQNRTITRVRKKDDISYILVRS